MKLTGRGCGTGMPKQCLDMPQAHAGLEQVSSEAVTKAVDRDFLETDVANILLTSRQRFPPSRRN
jgi:hypothetical protein